VERIFFATWSLIALGVGNFTKSALITKNYPEFSVKNENSLTLYRYEKFNYKQKSIARRKVGVSHFRKQLPLLPNP
jgi:hypothetical protein